MRSVILIFVLISAQAAVAQTKVTVRVRDANNFEAVAGATIATENHSKHLIAGTNGDVRIAVTDSLAIIVTAAGYKSTRLMLNGREASRDVLLVQSENSLGEVVVTGTMRLVQRTASPVPVEVYTPKFF